MQQEERDIIPNLDNDLIRIWTTTLEKLRQDNVCLKNRLSAAVQHTVSRSFLEAAEFYQQRFIDKDQIIDLLRYDISNLAHKSMQGGQAVSELQVRHLAKDIDALVSEFNQMKDSFNRYLDEYGGA